MVNENVESINQIDFGKKVRQLRAKLNMTQEELSTKIGTNKRNISLYENGKSFPHPSTLSALAKVLGIELTELVSNTTYKKKVLLKEATLAEIIERLHEMNIQPTFTFLKPVI